jgi:HlyD family secretion protein
VKRNDATSTKLCVSRFTFHQISIGLKERKIMNHKSVVLTLTLALLIVALTGCGLFGEEPTPEPVPVEAVQQPNVVSAEAFVVPVKEANLAFEVNGRVVSVPVEEGDPITEGQVLAELDDTTQRANLGNAVAGLAQAEAAVGIQEGTLGEANANLDKVRAGATPEEIAQAEAALAAAEAALAEVINSPTKEDIAQAEARVETARASLAQVLAGSRDEDIQSAASRLLQTEAEVREAQADYDENVYGDLDRLGPFGLALERATLNYEAAKADYDKLVNGATDEEIGVARAQLNEAQAALEKTLAGATPEQIAQAQAEVARAEASLAQLLAGATAEDIAVAEARVQTGEANVASAEAAVAQAETQVAVAETELGKTKLVAPFNGVVGLLTINEGEIVSPGDRAVAVGDSSRWQIETDDLTEIDVVQVTEGATVLISIDALPGEEFEGKVVRITPKAETKAGDQTYTILIDITKGDTSPLRWGMTSFVDIEVGPEL